MKRTYYRELCRINVPKPGPRKKTLVFLEQGKRSCRQPELCYYRIGHKSYKKGISYYYYRVLRIVTR